MNTLYLLAGIPVAALAAWEFYRHVGPKLAERATPPSMLKSDTDWMSECKCPDCHNQTLFSGPSGGMAQNIACGTCLMEFNVGFGFGTGPFMVERTGKMSAGRARVFGFTAEEYFANPNAIPDAAPVVHTGTPKSYDLGQGQGRIDMASSDD